MANKETMTVHKALCELKILDDRILKAIQACQIVGVKKTVARVIGSKTVDQFKADEIANYTSAADLIKRYNAIKRAVALSNATTEVVIGGEKYTVAEAIAMKNHGLTHKTLLRNRIANTLTDAEYTIKRNNDQAEIKADEHIQKNFGTKDTAKLPDLIAERQRYLESISVELVDPLEGGAKQILENLDKEISDFTVEVDAALSVSNATTNIEIEY